MDISTSTANAHYIITVCAGTLCVCVCVCVCSCVLCIELLYTVLVYMYTTENDVG